MKTLKNTKHEKPEFYCLVLVYSPKQREWVIAGLRPQDHDSNLGDYFYFEYHFGVHYPKVDGDVYWTNLPPAPKQIKQRKNP